jgi:hypothetical protein
MPFIFQNQQNTFILLLPLFSLAVFLRHRSLDPSLINLRRSR